MSTHYCSLSGVETEPRMPLMKNPTDTFEAKVNVLAATKELPTDVTMLIGGHPMYLLLLHQLSKRYRWKLMLFDTFTGKLYYAPFYSRVETMQLEKTRVIENCGTG